MNELISVSTRHISHLIGSQTVTMSSREIAEVVQSRHDSVKRSIERIAETGAIDIPPMVEYLDTLNRPAKEYLLDKRSSIIVVAQMSPEFTAALVDRWAQLEAEAKGKPVLPDFNNPIIAARAWADQAEGRMLAETAAKQLEATVSVQAEQLIAVEPKVRFHDAVGATTDCLKVEVVAKTLGYGRNTFYGLLRDEKILMYCDGGHTPYQSHAKHFEVKYQPYQRGDGDRGARPTSYVTGLGVLYLTRRFGKKEAA